jgi:hypothetical protein
MKRIVFAEFRWFCRWKGTANPREFAEICCCREVLCRGLIAKKSSKFLESSTSYYEGEITQLQEQHGITERALQQRYKDLAAVERVGSNTVELKMDLIQKENENGKLKASMELMIATVVRSRASLSNANSWMLNDHIVKAPEVKKSNRMISPLRKFMRRICFLFLHERKYNREQLAQVTIETSETNPYFLPDSALSSYRVAPAPSARSERLGSCTPRTGVPHFAHGPLPGRPALGFTTASTVPDWEVTTMYLQESHVQFERRGIITRGPKDPLL